VDPLATNAIQDLVAPQQLADRRLDPGKPQSHTGPLGELEDLA
jgi:hypothetical protein